MLDKIDEERQPPNGKRFKRADSVLIERVSELIAKLDERLQTVLTTIRMESGWIAVVLSVLAIAGALYRWLHVPTPDLIARITKHDFRMPPSLDVDIQIGIEKLNSAEERFFSRYPKQGDTDQAYSHARKLGMLMRCDAFSRRNVRDYCGYWDVDLRNDGTKACTQVRLSLPFARYALIEHSRDRPRHFEVEGTIVMDYVPPKSKYNIRVWTDVALDRHDTSGVELTHQEGLGKVRGIPLQTRVQAITDRLFDRWFG